MCWYLLLKLSLNRLSIMMVALGCCILLVHWNLLFTTQALIKSQSYSVSSFRTFHLFLQTKVSIWSNLLKTAFIIPVLSITYNLFVVARDLESGSISFSNGKSLILLLSDHFVLGCCACFPPYRLYKSVSNFYFSSQNISWWMLHSGPV